MAILVETLIPNSTAEQDDAMIARLGLDADPPAGSFARFAGPHEGGWRIISAWESQEAFDAYRRDRLEPALRDAGRLVPDFQISPLHSVRYPGRSPR